MLLAIRDFRINALDLLPDLAGYAIVAIDRAGRGSASPNFRTEQMLGWILLLF